MKSIIKFSVLGACILLLFAHCSKPRDYTSDYLSGKIDGVAFECSNIKANKPRPIPNGGGDDPTIIITGEWPGYTIKLNIHGEGTSLTTGSYVFQADKSRTATIWQNNVDAYYAGNGDWWFNPPQLYGSGRITIHDINKNYIKGSFEFVTRVNGVTGVSKSVTNGEFHIKRD